MIIVGNKIYERCPDCGKIVCLNKWLIGSAHICLLPAEKEYKARIGAKPFPPLGN